MTLYKIRNWNDWFENNRSRSVHDLTWVAIPNRHDGENFTAIITHKEGAQIFSAWVLMVQVASRCQPRGSLLRDSGKPHNSDSLSLKTRAPKIWFEKALDFLSKETDWLEIEELAGACQPPDVEVPPNCQAGDEEGKGREGKGTEGEGSAFAHRLAIGVREISEAWGEAADNVKLPKIAVVSDKRRRSMEARLRDPFFAANWRDALAKVCGSEFCKGKNERGWVADLDWFILPDSVPKIIEGKYDKRTHQPNYSQRPRQLTGAEQRRAGIPESTGLGAAEIIRRREQQKLPAAANGVAEPPIPTECSSTGSASNGSCL